MNFPIWFVSFVGLGVCCGMILPVRNQLHLYEEFSVYVSSASCCQKAVWYTHHISLHPQAIFAYTILTHSALPTTTVLKSKLHVLDPLAMKQGLTEDSLYRSSFTCDFRMTNAGGFQGMLWLVRSVVHVMHQGGQLEFTVLSHCLIKATISFPNSRDVQSTRSHIMGN